MNGFDGETTHPLDAKGRVSLPAKYRKILPDELVVVPSPDKDFPSLWVYSDEEYKKWCASVFEGKGGFQANSASMNHFARRLHGRKETVGIDKAGRILIPANLRQYASLDKTVRIIGVETHIEIWNEEILAQSDEFYDSQFSILDLP